MSTSKSIDTDDVVTSIKGQVIRRGFIRLSRKGSRGSIVGLAPCVRLLAKEESGSIEDWDSATLVGNSTGSALGSRDVVPRTVAGGRLFLLETWGPRDSELWRGTVKPILQTDCEPREESVLSSVKGFWNGTPCRTKDNDVAIRTEHRCDNNLHHCLEPVGGIECPRQERDQ